jgi:hypothetical protein
MTASEQAQKAAQEILRLFEDEEQGVVYVNPQLFKGKSVTEVEEIKARIRRVLAKWCV